MQLFVDTGFFVYAALLSLPAILLGYFEKPIRLYGFAVSLLFVFLAMKDSKTALVFLVIFLIWQLLEAKIYLWLRQKQGRKAGTYWLFMGLALLPLLLNKYGIAQHSQFVFFAFLGISYMEFKALQVIIQIYDGQIKQIDSFSYIYMMIFFPVLTSGPIDRSERFKKDVYRTIPRAEYLELVGKGLWKMSLGLVYKLVISAIFYQAILLLGKGNGSLAFFVNMYAYGFYLFFDFAGYSLMAVAMSYFFGIQSPDNFNKPFISKDMKEFWDRWHISLSHWFRDFVFSRITMDIMKSGKVRNKYVIASTAFIINMLIMGLWHGVESHYIIYGLYHGVLLAGTELYQKKLPWHKKYRKNPAYQGLSWFVTFNLVMFGLLIFSGNLSKFI
ncbi:D-alanyl-lipoteichoic acid biosynthesis protein DltB [Atopobacter sp. AH10]|uniref:D-alanyl-lipoteichoic acid biosynthesis protein DltB n=1 Tax=Atopobacter sp. AH10 TaxID=2315861 RepID=UPI000EF22294|nr:D-alanyl-lipoteichoic acid biosynthesis protein DltB [Atopobacter sp. AH10]RLK63112.1 D-alanyl-lipoteichoic acid biosynthesis protein DltB [Atopobacter sp. AH10]